MRVENSVMTAMSEIPGKKQSPRKYPVLARVVGVLILIGIVIGNAALFSASQGTKVNWQWTILVVVGVFVSALAVWLMANLIARVFRLELSSGQTIALRLLLFITIMGVSTVILRYCVPLI